ncbi:MAG TPA: universal stress protein [Candidatus Limnocylindrales bacterium]|jgi:nucleotide-binding universal stress UspA family protein
MLPLNHPASVDSETVPQTEVHGPSPVKIRTVLLATDLTPASEAATVQAISMAASLGARLLVVNVIDQGGPVSPLATVRVDQQRALREGPLLQIVNRARARGVEAAFLLWTGEPGQGIVAAAEAEGADMVIVGTRGLDRAGRFLLGSVSDYVVYHSSCPVMVAR